MHRFLVSVLYHEAKARRLKMTTLATQLLSSPGRLVPTPLTSLVAKMRDYFGDDIWQVLAEQPQWKINLLATRHYLACRFERNAGGNS